jgi:hypothetical protein
MTHTKLSPSSGLSQRRVFAWLTVLLLLVAGNTASAQQWERASLTRGKLWLTMNNAFILGGTVDIGSQYYQLDYPGYSTGADLGDHAGHMQAGGYMIYGERDGQAKAYTISTNFYPSEQYVYATDPTRLIKNYNLADPSLPAEEIITGAHMVRDLMVEVAHRSMAWSFPRYDDFIVHEVTITNRGDTPVTNLHFGTRIGAWNNQKGDWFGPGTNNDEKYGWDEEEQVFYVYDDWSFRWEDESPIVFNYGPGPETGDIGDPADISLANATTKELLSPAYMSSIALDCAGGTTYYNILQHTGQSVSTEAPLEDRVPYLGTHEPSRYLQVMTHQQPRMSWDEARAAGGEGGNKYERQPELLTSCGAFDLQPGESVTLVFAEVLGEMDRHYIVEGGVENVRRLAVESKAALLENVRAARELYNSGYRIDNPPPATPTDGENSLTLTAVGGGIEISWPAVHLGYTDPVTGRNDFAGYRVYQSTYFTTGPWDLVADIPIEEAEVVQGMVTYVDEDLPLGVGNYYVVTSYDDEGNESGMVNNNRFPIYPLRAPNEDFPNQEVYVVPNPFRQNSRLLGANEEYRMEFIGLPSQCVIRIYTITGDLVRQLEHNDGSGSEAWGSQRTLDYQTNEWMQYVAPGVYVFHVESTVPGHEGESFIGKFAIIR